MALKLNTTRFGNVEVDDGKILTFPFGLIGFPAIKRYALLDHPGGGPFQWLQAVDVPELAFVVTDPRLFFQGYAVPVRSEQLEAIGICEASEGIVVVILVVPKDPQRITANLMGPIVINLAERLACQLVLDHPGYGTRHALFTGAEPEPAVATMREEERQC